MIYILMRSDLSASFTVGVGIVLAAFDTEARAKQALDLVIRASTQSSCTYWVEAVELSY